MLKNKESYMSLFAIGAFFASILFGQLWLTIFLGIVVLFMTQGVSLIFGAFLFDLLHVPDSSFYSMSFVVTLFSVLLVVFVSLIKKRLR